MVSFVRQTRNRAVIKDSLCKGTTFLLFHPPKNTLNDNFFNDLTVLKAEDGNGHNRFYLGRSRYSGFFLRHFDTSLT